MTVGTEFFQQPPLEQSINVTDGGALPNGETFFHTPNTNGLDGGSNSRRALKKRKEGSMDKWPTPQSRDFRTGSEESLKPSNGSDRANDRLDHFVNDMAAARLNPDWCEKLMLWPEHWTSLEESPDMTNWGSTDNDWGNGTPRVVSICPNRVSRLKAIGNGQVPLCAATAWNILMERFKLKGLTKSLSLAVKE
jgi:hypothetical protein